jgi:hypothetical protein
VTTNANLTGHITSVGNAAVLGSFTKAQLDAAVSDGNVIYDGGALGTPSSGVATNLTGTATALNIGGSAASVTTTATVTGAITSSSPTAGIGYAAGAGGDVTQATSITTAVTLNAMCGIIRTVSYAYTAGTSVSFAFNNTSYGSLDLMIVNPVGIGSFDVTAGNSAGGDAYITIMPRFSGTVALNILFAVIKIQIS